jgi:indoleamine 2,3-dioxygenase
VEELRKFRSQHRAFAHSYIARFAQQEQATGTGGSDFMPALAAYRDTTGRARVG